MRDYCTIDEYRKLMKQKKPAKYRNTIIRENGVIIAHSKLELSHRRMFEAAERCGSIKKYEHGKPFILQDAFTLPDGKKVKPIIYIADHYVINNDGTQTVYDSKGRQTKDFRNKMKLFQKRYPHIGFALLKKSNAYGCVS